MKVDPPYTVYCCGYIAEHPDGTSLIGQIVFVQAGTMRMTPEEFAEMAPDVIRSEVAKTEDESDLVLTSEWKITAGKKATAVAFT